MVAEMIKKTGILLGFFLVMALGGQLHAQILPLEETFIWQSYGINAVLAAIALMLLSWGMQKKKANLTVLYLLTVALKLGVYFLFFYPKFQEDDNLLRQEFFIFFTPYALGLLTEIILLARRYN